MKEKTKHRFVIFFIIYSIIRVCCQAGYLYVNKAFMALLVIFMLSVIPVSTTYLIYLVFFCNHKKKIMNIIDGVLCYISIGIFIPPLYLIAYLIEKYVYIHVFFSVCFILLPLVFAIIDRKRIQKEDIFVVVSRISMVISVHLSLLISSRSWF